MKYVVNWIPLRIRVRSRNTQLHQQFLFFGFWFVRVITSSWKNWRIKKLENLVQNQSIGSIVCAQPTAALRNGRRDNAIRIMTI